MKACSDDVKARFNPVEGLMHKDSVIGSAAKQIDLLLEQFEVLDEILEENPKTHEQWSRIGGFAILCEMAIIHDSELVRKAACMTLSTVLSNNKTVQNYATKAGAVNLIV